MICFDLKPRTQLEALGSKIAPLVEMVNNIEFNSNMKRRSRGKSALKPTRLTPSPKRTTTCSFCRPRVSNAPVIAHGLYRKHSWTQNHHFLQLFLSESNKGQEDTSTAESEEEEYLGRYYKTASRRQVMSKLKSVYGLHREIPRLFQPEIREILEKCNHRKKLL
jgi:hypothetical protein